MAGRADPRLSVLDDTGLLDSPPEAAFDRLTRLASRMVRAPVALLTLVDEHRQFFKAAIGLGEPWATRRETPLTHSFCQYATQSRAPLVVTDAREHPVLRDSLAIRDLGAIAYAGIPLVVSDQAIGAFCVIDLEPRAWSEEELSVLTDLAASIVSEIELRLSLRGAREQRALLAALVEAMGDGVIAIDAERKILLANGAARAMFAEHVSAGVIRDDHPVLEGWAHPDGAVIATRDGALPRGLRGEATDGLTVQHELPGPAASIWLEATGRPVRDDAGHIVAAVGVYRDVTERRHEADALRTTQALLTRERGLLEVTLANIETGVVLLDGDRRILLANAAFYDLFGLQDLARTGVGRDVIVERMSRMVDDPEALRERLAGEPVSTEEFTFQRPTHRILRRGWTSIQLGDEKCAVVTWRDITTEKLVLEDRERQALVDALTQIPNRRAAETAIGVEEAKRKRHGTPLSVAVFDVDHFKSINDRFGHSVGDGVLRAVAEVLVAQGRTTDTVARWGGEEFLAVLPVSIEGARIFCERARAAVEAKPFEDAGRVTLSPGETASAAIARADQRLYEAKASGRNRVAS